MKTCATPLSRRPWKSSLALGAAALGTTGAQGAVIYNNFADVVNPGYGSVNLKFDPGTLNITAPFGIPTWNTFGFSAARAKNQGKAGFSYTPAKVHINISGDGLTSILGAGVLVNSSIAGGFTNEINPGANLSNVFAGVKFNDGGGGNIYYGWIRYSTGADNGGGNHPQTITILDAAFESNVNQGIVTGDIGSVPEPSRCCWLSPAERWRCAAAARRWPPERPPG